MRGRAEKTLRNFVPGPARRAGTGSRQEADSEMRFLNPDLDCNASSSKAVLYVQVRASENHDSTVTVIAGGTLKDFCVVGAPRRTTTIHMAPTE